MTCKRKWAFQYLDQIKPPSSKPAEFGSLVHKFLFNYLLNSKTAYETPEGQVALPGLLFLPKNLAPENLESYFAFTKAQHIFHGYIDFYENNG